MIIECSSNMFRIVQPSGYGRDHSLEKILAPAWMEAFKERFERRAKGNITISLEATGVDSPRSYNYTTDAALFNIHIPAKDLEKIQRQVFAYSAIFEAYLREYRKSYPGFISFMPYSLEKWEEYFAKEPMPWRESPPHHESWELAIFCLLEFWLFAFSADNPEAPPSLKALRENLLMFKEAFERNVDKQQATLKYEDYMNFAPVSSVELAGA